jgi:hypothetical protein
MPKTKKKEVTLIDCPHCDSFDALTWDLVQEHITLVHATVYEKACRGDYSTTIPYVRYSVDPLGYQRAHSDQQRLNDLFKHDLEVEHGVSDNPKRNKLFEIAWGEGHAYGFSEVASHYDTLVELIK